MVLYAKHHIALCVAADSEYLTADIDRSNRQVFEVIRTDFQVSVGASITLPAAGAGAYKLTLATALGKPTGLDLVRAIYIETSGPIEVTYFDDSEGEYYLASFPIAGPAGAGTAKFFAECNIPQIANGDYFGIDNASAVTTANVTYRLFGDAAADVSI